uniref:Candidate secreted effector n=1 Tax=Meloidogyne incognita TaxID=6306 RepID=A0A914LGB0_MELIC
MSTFNYTIEVRNFSTLSLLFYVHPQLKEVLKSSVFLRMPSKTFLLPRFVCFRFPLSSF